MHCLPVAFKTQTNMYEIVMEMNQRQLAVDQRVDSIEDGLRSLQVASSDSPVLKCCG